MKIADHFQYAVLGVIVVVLVAAFVALSVTNSGPAQLHDVLVAAVGGLLGVSIAKNPS